jgi:hypothetical protein
MYMRLYLCVFAIKSDYSDENSSMCIKYHSFHKDYAATITTGRQPSIISSQLAACLTSVKLFDELSFLC